MNTAQLKLPLIDLQKVEVHDGKLRILYVGIERDTQQHATIKYIEELPEKWSTFSEKEQWSWIRHCMIKALTHEIDEYFFLSKLGNDPHKGTL